MAEFKFILIKANVMSLKKVIVRKVKLVQQSPEIKCGTVKMGI